MAIQALGSIRELAIQWQEPVKTLIDLASVLTFDFHLIRITCIYGTDSPVLLFISQLLACPAACTAPWLQTQLYRNCIGQIRTISHARSPHTLEKTKVLLCSWLLSRVFGRPKPMDVILNHCGLLFFAFFLSITLTTLMPFQCVPNPDGSASMMTDPGIVCYQSDEHATLVGLAVMGSLASIGCTSPLHQLPPPRPVSKIKSLGMRGSEPKTRPSSEQGLKGTLQGCSAGRMLPQSMQGAVHFPCMTH